MQIPDLLGIGVVIFILGWFFSLLFSSDQPTVEESPDEVLGRTVRKVFRLVK
jgi:hypothetical protein